jgi:hypothetical protein
MSQRAAAVGGGWYCGNCRRSPQPASPQTPTGEVRRAVENTVSPEAVIGGTGPLWTVEARLRRPGVENYTETIHVRAPDEPGAISLAREMLLDVEDIAAYQVTED